jgi:iodotyrosine deiodinase
MTSKNNFIAYTPISESGKSIEETSKDFYQEMNLRRSIRDFSDKPISIETIENLILTASSAPSGAHKQPWTFCAISNPELKSKIRGAAEKEEYEFYNGRASEEWLKDLSPFGTDHRKPFLEIAPWIIVVFKKTYNLDDGEKTKNYYVQESVGIACGFLLAAIHKAGLVSLTHTPSPMNFLTKILGRPSNEKPYLLIPIGYPKEGAQVPNIKRKGLSDMSIFFD